MPAVQELQNAAGKAALPEELPLEGAGADDALERLAAVALEGAAVLDHPGYFAHMDPCACDEAIAASLLMTGTNQNMLHPDASPSARGLERRVIDWLAPFFAMSGGHMVSGGSLANITAMWAAREAAGVRRVIASDRAHNSIVKAADLLQLELVTVKSNPETHRITAASLEASLVGDLSDAAVILTAGTVAVGAVDDLSIAATHQAAWTHVDAAWCGPMMLSEKLAPVLAGAKDADSVSFSAHKWLYQPKGSGVLLFKDAEKAHAKISYGAPTGLPAYLATPTIGVLGSAPATALPLMMTMLSWGRRGIAERVEDDVAKAKEFARLVREDDRFDLWEKEGEEAVTGVTGIVAWRPKGWAPDPDAMQAIRVRLEGAWVSLANIDGVTWFRSVAANPNADPQHVIDRVVDAIAVVQ